MLAKEWLTELKVMGRSERTLEWYSQKVNWFLRDMGKIRLLCGVRHRENGVVLSAKLRDLPVRRSPEG